MWLPLVCGQKSRGVRLRSGTQAVGRCDVSVRVRGRALKWALSMISQLFGPFAQIFEYILQNDSFSNTTKLPKLEREAKYTFSGSKRRLLNPQPWCEVLCDGREAYEKRNDSENSCRRTQERVTSAEHVRYISGAFVTVSRVTMVFSWSATFRMHETSRFHERGGPLICAMGNLVRFPSR